MAGAKKTAVSAAADEQPVAPATTAADQDESKPAASTEATPVAPSTAAASQDDVPAAAKAERERIMGILSIGRVALTAAVKGAIEDPTCSKGDAAVRILEAGRESGRTLLANLQTDETQLSAPAATSTTEEPTGDAAIAQRISRTHLALMTPKKPA